MTLNDLWVRLEDIDSSNAAKMAKYSLVVTPTPWHRVDGCITSIRSTYSCAHARTYLLTYLYTFTLLNYTVGSAYKTVNISETVEDRAKVRPTMNGLYSIHTGFRLRPKCRPITMNDLCTRIKVIDTLNTAKKWRNAWFRHHVEWLESLSLLAFRPTYSCTRTLR